MASKKIHKVVLQRENMPQKGKNHPTCLNPAKTSKKVVSEWTSDEFDFNELNDIIREIRRLMLWVKASQRALLR